MLDALAAIGFLYLIYAMIAWMIGFAVWLGGVALGAALVVLAIIGYLGCQIFLFGRDVVRRIRQPLAGGRWH